MNRITSDPLDRGRFPVDEWALRETEFSQGLQGRTETLFTVGNGYLGLRGNMEEGRDGHAHGTFVNGFHETWPIRHAEEAYGFARVGQTIVNVPDSKVVRLYVDDEPLVVSEAEILAYSRVLDFRDGVLVRELEWRTPAGKRVRVRSRRMVSFTERHLAVIEYEVTLLDADATILISSQILNRQDGVDEYTSANGAGVFDPRKAGTFSERVLQPALRREHDDRHLLGYRTTHSGMAIACGAEHALLTECQWDRTTTLEDDLAKHVYRVRARQGEPVRLTKVMAYHSAVGVPVRELADRCERSLDRAREITAVGMFAEQQEWLIDFWTRSDVVVDGHPDVQQAVRWNLFQAAQATARTDGGGIAAKGVSGSGYGGHYFWDTEIYVLPFLTLHLAERGAERPALPAGDARRGPRPGGRAQPARAPCSRGAPSTGSSRRPTTRPARRSTTSTPTSRTPSCSTSRPPATGTTSRAGRSTSSSRPRACGRTSASGARTATRRSTSTA